MRQFTSSDAAALPFDTFLDVLPEDPSSDPAVVIRCLTDSAPPLTFQRLTRFLDEELDLGRSGLGHGDRLCVVVPNGPVSAVAFLALSQFTTYAPLNTGLTEAEFEFEFEDLPATAVAVLRGHHSPAAVAVATRRGLPLLEIVPYDDVTGLFRLEWLRNALPSLPVDTQQQQQQQQQRRRRRRRARRDDIALVLHTSGTTNKPKIVPLTHGNIVSGALMIASTMRLERRDLCLNIMPLFHIHGLVVNVLASVVAGAGVVCTPGNLPPRVFLDRLASSPRPSWYSAVPTMHQLILQHGEAMAQQAQQQQRQLLDHSLHTIRNCSAALLPAVSERLERLFRGATVLPTYAMTESMPICSNPRPSRLSSSSSSSSSGGGLPPRRLRSVGPASGPAVRVLLNPPDDCRPCEPGEVRIRHSCCDEMSLSFIHSFIHSFILSTLYYDEPTTVHFAHLRRGTSA